MTNQAVPYDAVVAAAGALWDSFDSGVDDFEQQAHAALEAAAPHMLAEAWDEAIQVADDEGCLLYHQAKGLKAANPYRNEA